MSQECEYSPAELRLIEHFGYLHLSGRLYPAELFGLMTKKAFLDNDQTPYAEALRRCVTALDRCLPYRMTPEFETLATVSAEDA